MLTKKQWTLRFLIYSVGLMVLALGTVVVMVLTGRVVYVFNRLFRRRLIRLAGLD